MLLGYSSSLGGEGKGAKVDREISICMLCTMIKFGCPKDK